MGSLCPPIGKPETQQIDTDRQNSSSWKDTFTFVGKFAAPGLDSTAVRKGSSFACFHAYPGEWKIWKNSNPLRLSTFWWIWSLDVLVLISIASRNDPDLPVYEYIHVIGLYVLDYSYNTRWVGSVLLTRVNEITVLVTRFAPSEYLRFNVNNMAATPLPFLRANPNANCNDVINQEIITTTESSAAFCG